MTPFDRFECQLDHLLERLADNDRDTPATIGDRFERENLSRGDVALAVETRRDFVKHRSSRSLSRSATVRGLLSPSPLRVYGYLSKIARNASRPVFRAMATLRTVPE